MQYLLSFAFMIYMKDDNLFILEKRLLILYP